MTALLLAMLIKPLGLVFMFAPGYFAVRWLREHLPAGRLRRFLLFSWRV